MKIKKLLAIVIAVVMTLALVPSALAAELAHDYRESRLLGMLDRVWEKLEAVEKSALEAGADRNAVTLAVYKAALNDELVDDASFNSLTEKSFFFTVNGMGCAYDYDARNYELSEAPVPEEEFVIVTGGTRGNIPGAMDILLVGPYYGHDSSFTDQYRKEAYSLATVTGGQLTILQSLGATGPAIAAACINKGVVIFDSHGTQQNDSSYLCLTTNDGITSEDYTNKWAVRSGSAAFIDGRYIQHHITEPLKNCFFWMAICEGMKKEGLGTTGSALLEAGAACVYGYSQSVTFYGDYLYEDAFWSEMKDGATVADAIKVMKETYGEPDPAGDAWPIVMSPTDPFPANPDEHQDVTCDWRLFDIDIESFSFTDTIDVYEGFSVTSSIDRVPDNANNYEVEWQSDDTGIATVVGNNRFFTVTGVSEGTVEIRGIVKVGDTEFGRASSFVTVKAIPTLNELLNAEGGSLEFFNPSAEDQYPWKVNVIDGVPVATSSNAKIGNSKSSVSVTVTMEAGDMLSFLWKVSSEEGYDYLYFYVNDEETWKISGETEWEAFTYTAETAGEYTFTWTFDKDPYSDGIYDCGFLKNVRLTAAADVPKGDADGDGTISASDALLVLRAAMNIIETTPELLALCDLDFDGVLTAAEALIILRRAMGIIA